MPIQKITTGVIDSIANTQITGTLTASQIAAVNGSVITANTIANSSIQTGAVENYMNSQSMNLGMRNRIINGNMAINQRATTSGVTSGYFVDRWTLSGCSTSATLTSSLPTGFNSGISISATSGNPIAIQKIEAANCSDLSGRNVTLSFYAKNISNATTLYASLAYAGSADSFGSTTTISERNLGTLTTDWVRYTYTWTNLPSGALNGLALNLLCAGSGTFTMGITGVQLEVGNAPTPFEFRSYGTELALCQRYYVLMAQGNGTGGNLYAPIALGVMRNATRLDLYISFPVTMRTAPSCISGSGTDYYYFTRGGADDTFNSFTLATNSVTNQIALLYNQTEVSGTTGQTGVVYTYPLSTSYVAFSAEL